MLSKFSLYTRRNFLLGFTALIVAYVRSFLQYHRYFWESVGQFFLSWFIHYLAVLVLVAISYALIKTKAEFFLGNKTENHKITTEEVIVYVSVVLLVAAILIFLIAHWPPADMYE